LVADGWYWVRAQDRLKVSGMTIAQADLGLAAGPLSGDRLFARAGKGA
jgi:hypothetical protein